MLYKVLKRSDWSDAIKAGVFSGCGIDLTDGFIHLSNQSQVVETVRLYFAGQTDLLLVSFDEARLGDSVRWEPSRDGVLFPHVYGQIPLDAVSSVDELVLGGDGNHQFPAAFSSFPKPATGR